MQMTRISYFWMFGLNLVLSIIMILSLDSTFYSSVSVVVTSGLIVLVIGLILARVRGSKIIDLRLIISGLGTALLWIPIYDAPGMNESTFLSFIIDASLVLGFSFLVASALWPRRI